ncbi:hypothetical protein B0H16DRAFT_1829968 [Mycena metata]|uniref:Glycosyltransferase family 69 protein n=1 Tax=Mycena metata TaxID=1033252 RepID=A0AAD7K712_9AGAR|nr:hypothetical protein B0H16DRAFT_1829968 [Mycena metata]
MTRVINYLGPDNVFVSIVESYSDHASPALLRRFNNELEAMHVPHLILTNETSIPRRTTTEADMGRPLASMAAGGYNRLLFSSDVFVEAESVVELLHTKDGDLYDLWVLRDRLGHLVSTLWPYSFENAGFRAVMADENAARARLTCWNGISPATHHDAPVIRAPRQSFNLPYDLRRVFALEEMYVNPLKHYVWYKYITRHWARGNGIHLAKWWDGGECHPGPVCDSWSYKMRGKLI